MSDLTHVLNASAHPTTSAAEWRKGRRSNPSGNCVELAELAGGGAAIRNSRAPEGPALTFTPAEVTAFIQSAKDGDFDHLLSA